MQMQNEFEVGKGGLMWYRGLAAKKRPCNQVEDSHGKSILAQKILRWVLQLDF